MAASFTEFGGIAVNPGFQSRVQYALVVQALVVHNEVVGTAGHPARLAFARNVLNGSVSLQMISLMILTNSTINAEAVAVSTPLFGIPDADIQTAVASLWNAMAGV